MSELRMLTGALMMFGGLLLLATAARDHHTWLGVCGALQATGGALLMTYAR